MSPATFYAWKSKYGGMDVSDAKRLKALEEENAKLKVVRANATFDWWRLDNPRKNMRVTVKRLLRKYGYPPDLEAEAVKRVVQQAEALAQEMSARAA
jgi:type I restriction enzyme R subunit